MTELLTNARTAGRVNTAAAPGETAKPAVAGRSAPRPTTPGPPADGWAPAGPCPSGG